MSSSETREFSDEFVTQELDQVHPQDARIIISLRRRSSAACSAIAPAMAPIPIVTIIGSPSFSRATQKDRRFKFKTSHSFRPGASSHSATNYTPLPDTLTPAKATNALPWVYTVSFLGKDADALTRSARSQCQP